MELFKNVTTTMKGFIKLILTSPKLNAKSNEATPRGKGSKGQNYVEGSKGHCHYIPIRYYGRAKLGLNSLLVKSQRLLLFLYL